jgi:uncharacterized membrane protein YbhN (UPF0104 family)
LIDADAIAAATAAADALVVEALDASARDAGMVAAQPLTPAEPITVARRLWRWLKRPVVRTVVTLAVFIVALATLHDRLPDGDEVSETLRGAEWGWLSLAIVAEVLSLVMFARQQRRLLSAFGVTISVPRAVAVTYVRSALTASMPAGSALSAGYAFRQYRMLGANRATSAAVTALSGAVTMVGLAFLYTGGALYAVLVQPYTIWKQQPALLAGGVVGLVAIVAAGVWWWRKRRAAPEPPLEPIVAERKSGLRWWKAVLAEIPVAVRDGAAIRRADWLVVFGYSMANWAGDLICLIAVALAFKLDVAWPALIGIYLGAQLVRQLPLTPGGIGLIETGLLAGMVGAGAGQAIAAAVVLVYRLLSCWLMVPLGGLAWLTIRGRRPNARLASSPTNGV